MNKPEVVLPRRVVPQPSPGVYPGGDCGACCIAGVLGISIERAYELQDKDERPVEAKDKPHPFGWQGMAWALKNGGWGDNDLIDAVLDAVPIWPWEGFTANLGMGLPGHQMNLAWWNYVRMGLLGGFYGICHIDIDGKVFERDHNHWVVICGAREIEEPIERPGVPAGCSWINQQILVSCSAHHPQGEWRNAREFLRNYGGFNIIMVKPKN